MSFTPRLVWTLLAVTALTAPGLPQADTRGALARDQRSSIERHQVGASEVIHVDVIPNTGSVKGGTVGSKNRENGVLTERDLGGNFGQ